MSEPLTIRQKTEKLIEALGEPMRELLIELDMNVDRLVGDLSMQLFGWPLSDTDHKVAKAVALAGMLLSQAIRNAVIAGADVAKLLDMVNDLFAEAKADQHGN